MIDCELVTDYAGIYDCENATSKVFLFQCKDTPSAKEICLY